MDKTMLLMLILVFFTVVSNVIIILNAIYRKRLIVKERFDNITESKKKSTDEMDLPFYQRVIKPMFNKFSKSMNTKNNNEMFRKVDEKLMKAGRPFNANVKKWFALRFVFTSIFTVFIIFIMKALPQGSTNTILMYGVLIIFAISFPNLYLSSCIKKRQEEIQKSLPDILDLLSVSMEAGVSFDGAILKLTKKMSGVLPGEFDRALKEINIGKSRKDALKDMAFRCGSDDLKTIISALIQAEQFGTGLCKTLRIQSDLIRQKTKQRIQEKAMKAPVKMLIPMVFFIFPTIFIVLLGPGIITIFENIMK